MRKPKDARIAVLGAGVSGIMAARELAVKGYTRVTVYEKTDRIGGKTVTFSHDGQPYDASTVIIRCYSRLHWLARELRVPIQPFPELSVPVAGGGTEPIKHYFLRTYSVKEQLAAYRKLVTLIARNPKIALPGLEGLDPSVMVPMSEFVQAHPALGPLADTAQAFLIGVGYGYYDEVPAIYYLKFIYIGFTVKLKRLLRNVTGGGKDPEYFFCTEGFHAFLEALARGQRIVLGAEVTALERRSNGALALTVNGVAEEFDHVLATAPPNDSARLLGAWPDLSRLLGGFTCYDYYSVIFRASGLGRGEAIFYRDNHVRARIGEVLVTSHYRPGDTYLAWLQFPRDPMPDAEVEAAVATHVRGRGGELAALLSVNRFKYFPHLGTEGLRAGVFDDIHRRQGRDGLYLLGSALNMESAEHCVRYARYLVGKHF